jgi:hypothetical protein
MKQTETYLFMKTHNGPVKVLNVDEKAILQSDLKKRGLLEPKPRKVFPIFKGTRKYADYDLNDGNIGQSKDSLQLLKEADWRIDNDPIANLHDDGFSLEVWLQMVIPNPKIHTKPSLLSHSDLDLQKKTLKRLLHWFRKNESKLHFDIHTARLKALEKLFNAALKEINARRLQASVARASRPAKSKKPPKPYKPPTSTPPSDKKSTSPI